MLCYSFTLRDPQGGVVNLILILIQPAYSCRDISTIVETTKSMMLVCLTGS